MIPPADWASLSCPACGYDLRATLEPRCPECGRSFNPQTLASSQIPWVHRKALGHVRAWWHTTRLTCGISDRLSAESDLPVDWRSATRFRWISIFLATALITIACFFAIYIMNVGILRFPYIFSARNYFNPFIAPIIIHSASVTFNRPVSMAMYPLQVLNDRPFWCITAISSTLLSGACVSWWLRTCFWLFAGSRRARASALSCYLMAAWPVIVILLAADAAFVRWSRDPYTSRYVAAVPLALALVNCTFFGGWFLKIILTLRRMGSPSRRAMTAAIVLIPCGTVCSIALSIILCGYAVGTVLMVYVCTHQ
jgi:hypothetical protein